MWVRASTVAPGFQGGPSLRSFLEHCEIFEYQGDPVQLSSYLPLGSAEFLFTLANPIHQRKLALWMKTNCLYSKLFIYSGSDSAARSKCWLCAKGLTVSLQRIRNRVRKLVPGFRGRTDANPHKCSYRSKHMYSKRTCNEINKLVDLRLSIYISNASTHWKIWGIDLFKHMQCKLSTCTVSVRHREKGSDG